MSGMPRGSVVAALVAVFLTTGCECLGLGFNGDPHPSPRCQSDSTSIRHGGSAEVYVTNLQNARLVSAEASVSPQGDYRVGAENIPGRGSTSGYTAEITFIGNHPLLGQRH